MSGTGWTKAAAVAVLGARDRAVVKLGRRQVALFRDGKRVLACNNRCPHEGYPLVEGSLGDGCVLTCNWHNWKFDLRDGRNLTGFDELTVYPTRVADGHVWVRLVDPPRSEREAKAWRRLREAYDDHDYERIARELARLRATGVDAVAAVARAIEWSHDRLEFGMTHAYAAAADWLALHDEPALPSESRMACLVEAIGHISWDALRFPVFPYRGRRRRFSADALEEAIESEDEPAAIGLVRGALAEGKRFADVERSLARAALRHYADFGHSLIYLAKASALAARLGPAVERPLLLALVRALVQAFREDKIPEFRHYAEARARWSRTRGNGADLDPRELQGAPVRRSLDWVVAHAGHPPEDLYRALLAANARNLLAFDERLQDRVAIPVGDNVGWLDFTHALTFGSALRTMAGRYPELWPDGLLQLACFNGRNARFVDGAAAPSYERISDPAAYWNEVRDRVLDHGLRDYIFAAHRLKTASAVRAETGRGADDDLLMAALNRYLAGRAKEKHVRRAARQALAFVAREG